MGIPSRAELSSQIKIGKTDGGDKHISLKMRKEDTESTLDISLVLRDTTKHGMFLIGRNKEGLDLVLRHDTISRVHAAIVCGGVRDVPMVVDLKSSKGTFVNGSRLEPNVLAPLKAGDVLTFGKSERTYTVAMTAVDGQTAQKALTERAEAAVAAAAAEAEAEAAVSRVRENEEEQGQESKLAAPVADNVDLMGHTKPVVAMAIDRTGSRVLTGSLDHGLNIYDFSGMAPDLRPFSTFEPVPGHTVTWLAFSPSSDSFVCVAGDASLKFYSREGDLQLETCRGDVYIRDLVHTKGHTMEITQAHWHPNPNKTAVLKGVLLSSSQDGTLRLWTKEAPQVWKKLVNRFVIKPRSALGSTQRIGLHCCSWSVDGSWIFAGDAEGSVHVFKHVVHSREYAADGGCAKIQSAALSSSTSSGNAFAFPTPRPYRVIRSASDQSLTSPMSYIVVHASAALVASRCEDGYIRVWQKEQLTGPGPAMSGTAAQIAPPLLTAIAENSYAQANVAFSPDGSILCAASAVLDSQGQGHLEFWSIDANTANTGGAQAGVTKPTLSIPLSTIQGDSSPSDGVDGSNEQDPADSTGHRLVSGAVLVHWQSEINQVLVGTCGGTVRVFFDREVSKKGALLPCNRTGWTNQSKSKRQDYVMSSVPSRVPDSLIITPNALPMFRETNVAIKDGQIITGAAAEAHVKQVEKSRKRDRDGGVAGADSGERQSFPLKPSTQGPGKSVIDFSFKYAEFAKKQARGGGTANIVAEDPVAALHAKAAAVPGEPSFFTEEVRILASKTAEEEDAELALLRDAVGKGKSA